MSDYVEKWLRIAAEEIRADGHAGWGNTCEDGANHIAGLERYIAEIERGKVEALGMAAELEAEDARLREVTTLLVELDDKIAATRSIENEMAYEQMQEDAMKRLRALLGGGEK